MDGIPASVKEAVLKPSTDRSNLKDEVKGYNFNNGVDYDKLFGSYYSTGLQATNFGLAVEEIRKMLKCRDMPFPVEKYIDTADPYTSVSKCCTIFLGYTSNIVSSGLREHILFLVQHKLVDCIVTTAGGIEEDIIKCLAPTYLGDFNLVGKELREKGINRIGNMLVPNENYCKFEDWLFPILNEMYEEQKDVGTIWTPSRMIAKLGEKINDKRSIYYWAHRNKIPVFSPALTDGSLGDMMYFFSFNNPDFILDILGDLRRLNTMATRAVNTGMIIIGGGLVKHHICNANLMRNGADFAVFLNTASEFDGSDAGARPDEAVSWGKIRSEATPVKIYAEASLIFPLLVGETFAKYHFQNPTNEDLLILVEDMMEKANLEKVTIKDVEKMITERYKTVNIDENRKAIHQIIKKLLS